jgi:hypothetical protein
MNKIYLCPSSCTLKTLTGVAFLMGDSKFGVKMSQVDLEVKILVFKVWWSILDRPHLTIKQGRLYKTTDIPT